MKLECHKSMLEEEDGISNDGSAITHHYPSAPMIGTGNGFVYKATSNHLNDESQSLINFNSGGESLLSFQQKELCLWENNNGLHHQWNQIISPTRSNNLDPSRLIHQDYNCIQTTSCYGRGSLKEKQHNQQKGESSSSSYGWLYSEPNDTNSLQDSSPIAKEAFNKRLSMVFLPPQKNLHFVGLM